MKYPALLAALAVLLVLPPAAAAYAPAPEGRLAEAAQARALRHGDTGPEVAALQELLRSRGFDPGPIDGIFGPLTEAAVRAAQQYFGLEVDGLAGRLTVGALRLQGGAARRPAESGLVIYQAQAEADPVAWRRGATKGLVALTFHHLPDAATLETLLETLAREDVRATFFVTAEEGAARPADLRRIRAAGHAIGSLGYREVDMRRLDADTARAHLKMARQVLRSAVGLEPALFRPPLGRFDRSLVRIAQEEGLQLILWANAGTFAAPGVGPERLAELVSRALYPGAVLMLPLDEPVAADAVAPLLARIAAEGYRIAPVEEVTRSTKGDR